MKIFNIFKRKDPFKDSNYGRKEGWYIELKGRRIGELINPERDGEFWFKYELILFDESLSNAIESLEFWDDNPLAYYSKSLEKYYSGIEPIVTFKPEYSSSKKKVVSIRLLGISS